MVSNKANKLQRYIIKYIEDNSIEEYLEQILETYDTLRLTAEPNSSDDMIYDRLFHAQLASNVTLRRYL